MPLELLAVERRTPELREYDPEPVGPDEVRLRSEFSAFKHGTGLRSYRADTRDFTAAFDWEQRLHREGETHTPDYPVALGNVTVGTVEAAGDGVERFGPGDRVWGYLPIRETHTVPAGEVDPVPGGMAPEAVVYADPARVGLHAVRTAGVRVGDVVAVFGAGAIGQMATRIARLQGARRVAVSEPIERRREATNDHADVTVDPAREDAGEVLKESFAAGEEAGVDAAIETSGAYAGLHDAVRSTAFGGVVASCGYYADDSDGLRLEGEWHRNRLDVRTVRPPSEPLRDSPRWDLDRLSETAFSLLSTGRLPAEGLVDPVVPIRRADEGMCLIDERPEESIKLGVTYE